MKYPVRSRARAATLYVYDLPVDRLDLANRVLIARWLMLTERRLSELLSEFARTLVTNFPIQAILDHLVVRIAEILPIGSAGVTLISPTNEARNVAASDESALRFVKLQTEMGEGPCITAFRTGETVVVPDLELEEAFPDFSRRALEEGLRAVFSFPLSDEDHRLGALDLYRRTPGPMDAEAMEAAQTLADVTTAYILNAEARADLEISSEEARHGSLHDALTGLPNRTLFIQRLDHAVMRGRRSGKMAAVFFADLDEFKLVNDGYGHQVGDELLVAVADRLSRLMRPGDTLARIGGDEFVILCEDLEDATAVDLLSERIGTALAESFTLSDSEHQVSASVGIAFAGLAEDVPERVLQEADAAMYQAKRRGGGRFAVIDLRERRVVNQRARLNRDLRGALQRGELDVEYQPIVVSTSGRVVGAEALLRWFHPGHGPVKPEVLVGLAEQSGAIIDIGRWLFERACLESQTWQGDGLPGAFGISINVSVRQLMSAGFVASMASVMRDTGTEPARVTLEVTESALAYDDARALSVVGGLKHLGVNIALDDFGTGQSSLSRLKQFPVDSIKIDQAFVTDLEISIASRLIVGAVTDLAHGMGMTVVAEGVETAGQRAEVVKLNCDFSQGFYFAQPQSLASMNAIVSDRETLPLSDSSVHAAYRRSVRSGLEAGQLADSSAPSSDPVTPVDLGSSAPAMRRRHRP